MADELRERAAKLVASMMGSIQSANGFQDHVQIAADFAAAERALALENAAKVADGIQDEYRESAAQLDAAGFHKIANHDIHGILTCKEIALKIRSLTPLPTDGEDFGDVTEQQR